MKYKNAGNILPKELLEMVQQYVQGEYLYIPIKERQESTEVTEYRLELQKRDERIYTGSLEGIDNKRLALIYNLTESSIRRIISRQRKRYQAVEQRIRNILKQWEIDVEQLIQIYDTAWQVNGGYVIKIYDNLHMLEGNIKMVSILVHMHIPVGRLFYTKEDKPFAADEEYYYILSERLKGSNVVLLKGNLDIMEEMGRIIARLHMAFRECETTDTFWENSLLGELKGWIYDTFYKTGWELLDESAFAMLLNELMAIYSKLPVQLIHRDVHFGNFLFEDNRFSGYIDFDLSQKNIRIFDLCYFMNGLLSEEEALGITEEEWFICITKLFIGYQQLIPLTEEEKCAVPHVMKGIELLFAAWFLEQKDMVCAKNAMKIYAFVERNKERIYVNIEKPSF